MAWYRAGTVAVTNGSTTVTGSGTDWIAGVGIGEAFNAPDGRVYEIAAIVSATQLTLGTPYLGASTSGQTYQIVPSQSYIRDLANQASQLVATYADLASTAGSGKFPDGTISSPGIRFSTDENTGIRRAGSDDMRLVVGGADQVSLTAAGLNVQDGKLRITGTFDATKVASFEVDGFTAGASRVFTLPDASTTLVGTDTTQTLTNKTLTNPVVNLTGGTANGVAYLNGSKALTTGSALTFDGSGLFGLGRAVQSYSPLGAQNIFEAFKTTVGAGFLANFNDVTKVELSAFNGAAWLSVGTNNPLVFGVNNSEQMRLTSTGLGIGTSSPTEKLDVTGNFKLSGSATLSGGTANGVAYLNASKVLTTGSALRTNGQGLGIGVAPVTNVSLLDVETSTGRIQFRKGSNTGGTTAGTGIASIDSAGSVIVDLNYRASNHAWIVDSTEAMRLTSTGLGIGTSSPAYKLDVVGAINTNNAVKAVSFQATNTNGLTLQDDVAGGFLGYGYASGRTNPAAHIWYNGITSELMRLSSSGNLGLGVTPSGWGVSWKAMDIGNALSLFSGASATVSIVGHNYYNNAAGVETYKNSNYASYYRQQQGTHAWFTAPSGTAGNPITFTQAMTLDASGNLLVGTTSVYNSARISVNAAGSSGSIALSIGNANDTYFAANFRNAAGISVGNISCTVSATAYNTSSDYRLKNITGPITTSGAYIDSLNPVEGTWKADGSTFIGLIAHEVQEVSRTNVATGVKDGPEMQAMDYSSAEIIANLIAEVKSLRARVAQLETAGV